MKAEFFLLVFTNSSVIYWDAARSLLNCVCFSSQPETPAKMFKNGAGRKYSGRNALFSSDLYLLLIVLLFMLFYAPFCALKMSKINKF
jgi:hypothetical protein